MTLTIERASAVSCLRPTWPLPLGLHTLVMVMHLLLLSFIHRIANRSPDSCTADHTHDRTEV